MSSTITPSPPLFLPLHKHYLEKHQLTPGFSYVSQGPSYYSEPKRGRPSATPHLSPYSTCAVTVLPPSILRPAPWAISSYSLCANLNELFLRPQLSPLNIYAYPAPKISFYLYPQFLTACLTPPPGAASHLSLIKHLLFHVL